MHETGALSVDKLALDVKDEDRVGWDVRGAAGRSVRHARRDGESSFAPHLQPGHSHVPALDSSRTGGLKFSFLQLARIGS